MATLDALFETVNRSDAPGLVVGVSQLGKTVYRRGFGLASVELGVANTPWTRMRMRMRIGSTSKHFACLAALLLGEAGTPLVGRYRAADLDADAQIAFVGDKLQLQVFGAFATNLMELAAFSGEVFGWTILDAGNLPLRGVLSVERANGVVKGFRINTPRIRHMLFERVTA